MVKLEIAHKDAITLILDYLLENNLTGSLLALEKETGLSLFKYSSEITILRFLILEGNWQQVENLLRAVSQKGHIEMSRGMFQIKRQIYLEMLSSQ
jgi:hypothetical protein